MQTSLNSSSLIATYRALYNTNVASVGKPCKYCAFQAIYPARQRQLRWEEPQIFPEIAW